MITAVPSVRVAHDTGTPGPLPLRTTEGASAPDLRGLQAADDDVVDAAGLAFPVACRVELPESCEGEDHILRVEVGAQGACGDVRLQEAAEANPRTQPQER